MNYLFFHCSEPCSITAAGLLSLLKTTVWFLLQFFSQLLFHKKASSLTLSLTYFPKVTLMLLHWLPLTQKETKQPDANTWNVHSINKCASTFSPKNSFIVIELIVQVSNFTPISESKLLSSPRDRQIVLTWPATQINMEFFFSNFRRTTVIWRAESPNCSELFTHLAYREKHYRQFY